MKIDLLRSTFLLIVLGLLVFTHNLKAQITLDTEFNSTGIQYYNHDDLTDRAFNVGLQDDGKILTVGFVKIEQQFYVSVIRYNADGTFDNSFASDGVAVIDVGILNSLGGFAPSVDIQTDGKILVSGPGRAVEAEPLDMALFRLNTDGLLDATFGDGGITFIDVKNNQNDMVNSISFNPNSTDIVICGVTRDGPYPSHVKFSIARIKSDGTLDNSFGDQGLLLLDLTDDMEYAEDVIIQPDGKILVGGYGGETIDYIVIRLDENGGFDESFGSNGVIIVNIDDANFDYGYSMSLLPTGKILLAGHSKNTGNDFAAVIRLNTDGSLDNTYGTGGIATMGMSAGDLNISTLFTKPNGYALIAGYLDNLTDKDFFLGQFTADGLPDPDFGTDGTYVLDVTGTNLDDEGHGMIMQPDGKVIISGTVKLVPESGLSDDHAIVRLVVPGIVPFFSPIDTTFCAGGTVQFTELSIGDNLSYNWEFEGGSPATSTDPNPLVTYNTDGVFDVELTISNNDYTESYLAEDAIKVIDTPAAPEMPEGPAELCESDIVEYTTTAVQYATEYVWELSPSDAGEIEPENTICTLNVSNNWTGDFTLKVMALNSCGEGEWSDNAEGTINAKPQTFILLGGGGYCEDGEGVEITLDGSESDVDYELYLDGAATGNIVSGTGSSISFGLITEEGSYSAKGINDNCTTVMQEQVDVYVYTIPLEPGTPTGPETACNSESSIYESTGVDNADSYAWLLTPSVSGTFSSDELIVTIDWSADFSGMAHLSLFGINDCGEGAPSDELEITILSAPSPEVEGLAMVCDFDVTDYNTVENAGNTYVWEVTGGEITEGQGTTEITVSWGISGSGQIMVTEQNNEGCIVTSEVFNVFIDDCTDIIDSEKTGILSIYPNPAIDKLKIESSFADGSDQTLVIRNQLGQIVRQVTFNQTGTTHTNVIDINDLPKGMYFVGLKNDDKISTHTFLKN